MNNVSDTDLAWFCGLFEGEGSFWFAYGEPKGIQITMTDLDILERVKSLFGGSICQATRVDSKPHWKDAWRWCLSLNSSLELIPLMLPNLGKRRNERADEFVRLGIEKKLAQKKKSDSIRSMRDLMKEKYDSGGYTHQKIADEFGVDRTYVTHILAGKYDRVIQ